MRLVSKVVEDIACRCWLAEERHVAEWMSTGRAVFGFTLRLEKDVFVNRIGSGHEATLVQVPVDYFNIAPLNLAPSNA